MKRNRNHRDRKSTRSFSIFEPLENRRLMSGGELDPTFGQGGIASILPYSLHASDVAVQQDGKTVVVGTETYGGRSSTRFFTARFDVDGKLDTTFNARGFVATDIGEGDDEASAVAIQPDGKIVVVGTRNIGSSGFDGYYGEFAVVRLNSNGTLDKTFDGDGKKAIRVKDSSTAYDVAIQSDGKIVIAGGDYNGGFSLSGYNANSDFAAVRLNPNGSLDGTFGFLGKALVPMGFEEYAHAVTVDYTGTLASNPNYGKIILAGTHHAYGKTYMALARLNANGTRDGSFDRVPGLPDTGYNIDPFPGHNFSGLNGVLMQPDGKIVVAGFAGDASSGPSNQFALARYDANGKLDKSFGPNGNGTVETGFGGADFGQELVQLHNGKLILAGTVNGSGALAAYDANGKLDTSFGSGGKVSLDVGAGLAVAPDGRLLITGGNDFVTARLLAQKPKVTILSRLDASEAGPSHGMVTIFRDGTYSTPTRVFVEVSGNAILGSDYSSNLTTVASVASGSTLGGSSSSGSGGSFGFGANVIGGFNNFLTFSGSGAGNIIAGGIGGILGHISGGVINSNLRYIDIPAGQRSVNVPVTVNDDSQLEPHETATFTLAPDAAYELAGSTQASVLIKDNDEVHVNFQTISRFPPAGYAADIGTVFGDKGGGLFYGWDADNTTNARVRNSSASPDLRYDTFNHMQKNGVNRTWEIAVPNGLYIVRIVAGDPSATDSLYKMSLEGETALLGFPGGDVRWFRNVVRVQVNDGRLTLGNGDVGKNNKIAFIDIKAAPAGTQPGLAINSMVRQYSSATAQNWTTKPNGLRTDNQRDEEIWA